LRVVGSAHSGADPPETDLESDAGGNVAVWQAYGLTGVEPHVANEGRQQRD